MTVSELIEELRQLPGDADLRMMKLSVVVSRPHSKTVVVDGGVLGVTLRRDVAVIEGNVFLE